MLIILEWCVETKRTLQNKVRCDPLTHYCYIKVLDAIKKKCPQSRICLPRGCLHSPRYPKSPFRLKMKGAFLLNIFYFTQCFFRIISSSFSSASPIFSFPCSPSFSSSSLGSTMSFFALPSRYSSVF